MPIEPGTKLGHYEIVGPLGAGGQGEVYRARDTRLDRTVAIKVLPEHLSNNERLRQRFEQEARAVSSLNHPNICTLHDIHLRQGSGGQVGYDVDVDFMVMECIEGETLADRLQRGPLPLDEALRTAIATGDALDKAHRQGIVHRDLKPGNIMLTKSGPKLLDFGLATRRRQGFGEARGDESSLPTEQKPLTEEGAILGTLQYMAPEQLEGGEIDTRTDIFAFGALLYEMVTGQKAFTGKSQASLISAIMSSEPQPISELLPVVPKSLERLVRGCLAKDPDDRWQSARDVVMQLESIGDAEDAASAPATSRTAQRLAWAALLVGIALIAGVWSNSTNPPRAETTRAVIPLPAGDQLIGGSSILGFVSSVDISADGRMLAYVAESGGDPQLYLRRLDALEATPVTGTELATAPFFSSDGQWVGFGGGRGDVRKTAVQSGTTIDIVKGPSPPYYGASWLDDTVVVGRPQQLSRISDGDTGTVAFGDEIRGRLVWPQILPGGKHVLVTLLDPERVAIVSMEGGEVRTLLDGYGGARFVPSGHLIVGDFDAKTLLAAPFDLDKLEIKGAPVPVVHDVYVSPRSGLAHFAVSDTGTLVYVPGGAGGNALVWVDRRGNVVEALDMERSAYGHPRLSPDGTRVAVDNFLRGDRNIWVYDLARGTRIRLSSVLSAVPAWTPDGSRVSFYSQVEGPQSRLDWRPADASSDAETLHGISQSALNGISWSPDGTTLAYEQAQPEGGRNIYLLSPGEQPRTLLATLFDERSPMFSPDGHFLAYVSDESGRSEVYVRPYPEGDQKWSVSTDGGQEPVWSPDGRELFYRKEYKMMAVPVELGSDFHAGRPSLLFEALYYTDTSGHPAYDISTDGQRFLMIQDSEDERTQINVVFNWFSELERLVPIEK